AMRVEQQVLIAEMWAGHVPMEILGLEIQRKHIRQKQCQCDRDTTDRLFRKRGWSRERRFLQHVSDLIDERLAAVGQSIGLPRSWPFQLKSGLVFHERRKEAACG